MYFLFPVSYILLLFTSCHFVNYLAFFLFSVIKVGREIWDERMRWKVRNKKQRTQRVLSIWWHKSTQASFYPSWVTFRVTKIERHLCWLVSSNGKYPMYIVIQAFWKEANIAFLCFRYSTFAYQHLGRHIFYLYYNLYYAYM